MKRTTGFFINKRKANDIGIEIEVESIKRLPTPPVLWGIKPDTSLRNAGGEYYLENPIAQDINKRRIITSLTNILEEEPIDRDSPRTSVHVHVNVTRHTPLQVWTAAVAYWLLDNILIKYCGEEQREGNVHCLRLIDAEHQIKAAMNDVEQRHPFSTLVGDHLRYASQNLNAIRMFGSLEYRGMRGTIDPDVIDIWSTEMYNIVHRSKRYSSPTEILETCVSLGGENFAKTVLSDTFVSEIREYGEINHLVKDNVGILLEFCYSQNWTNWERKVNEVSKPMRFSDD